MCIRDSSTSRATHSIPSGTTLSARVQPLIGAVKLAGVLIGNRTGVAAVLKHRHLTVPYAKAPRSHRANARYRPKFPAPSRQTRTTVSYTHLTLPTILRV